MSFDFKHLCKAHSFYGQFALHTGRKFYKRITTLCSLGYLELLLQTILGRGTRTLSIQILSLRQRVLIWASKCPSYGHCQKSHYCGEKNLVISYLSLSSTGNQFQCSIQSKTPNVKNTHLHSLCC